jgi:hypothetical protein
MISKIGKRALLIFFVLSPLTSYLSPLTSSAQTVSSFYQPGVTAEGAVYFLPKTAVRVTVEVEKTTYTPGDLCQYAERYLRLRDVSPTPSVGYRITAIRQEPVAVADTTKRYAVKFDPRTSATNIRLSDDGVLVGINTEVRGEKQEVRDYTQPKNNPLTSHSSPLTSKLNPRQFMSEDALAAGSTSKMAELIAQDIYEIRDSRNQLVRGQADNMPKDGEQLRLMLNQLNLQDRALTSLFAGTTVSDTTRHTFLIVPDSVIVRDILFRFSQKLGLVDADDLAGVPYYINIDDLSTVPAPAPVDPRKKLKPIDGIFVNIPGRLRATISDGQQAIITSEFPAGQFGNVELLSGSLFNKRFTTRLWLNPLSGAIERLDAEQPK